MGIVIQSPANLILAYGVVPVGAFASGDVIGYSSNFMGQNDDIVVAATITGTGNAAFQVVPPMPPDTQDLPPQEIGAMSISVKFTPSNSTPLTCTLTLYLQSDPYFPAATITLTGQGSGTIGVGEAPFLVQSFRRELVPIKSSGGVVTLGYLNEENFNDANDSGQYIFKAEDILANRVPTIRRVVLTYVDLGVATPQFTINGSNDNGQLVTITKSQQIGTVAASGLLLTAFIDITISCFRPQLTITRPAGAGPVQISTVLIVGTVETEVTL